MGKTCPLSGKTSWTFPLRPGLPKAILTLPLFLNPFLPISSLTPLPVWTYTQMQTDVNTRAHWWTMWCLVSISASSLPAPLSLSLVSNGDKKFGDTLVSWLHLSIFLFVSLHLETGRNMKAYHASGLVFMTRGGVVESQMGLGRWHTPAKNHNSSCLPIVFFSLYFCLSFLCLHLPPASFHPGLDLKFHSKGAILAPPVKWVIILLAMPTLNLYKCLHSSNSSLAS